MKTFKGDISRSSDIKEGPVQVLTDVDFVYHNKVPKGTEPISATEIGYLTMQGRAIAMYSNGAYTGKLAFHKGHYPEVRALTGTMGDKLKALWPKTEISLLPTLFSRYSPTLGFDPEFFAEDENGNVIPAWMWLPDKENKLYQAYPGDTWGAGYFYWDGFQAEFAVTESPTCMQTGVHILQFSLQQLDYLLKKKFPKAHISAKSTYNIDQATLVNCSAQQVAFGCMPSKNAYGEPYRTVANPYMETLRPAGGHIHFGLNNGEDEESIVNIVKGMDKIVGVISVALFDGMDNPDRRKLYGRAGEYRTPEHGLEYRVLSNAWLTHPTVAFLVMDIARWALDLYVAKKLHCWQATEQEVQECINTSNAKSARAIVLRNKEVFEILGKAYWEGKCAKAWDSIMKGLVNTFPKFDKDVAKAWTGRVEWQTWEKL